MSDKWVVTTNEEYYSSDEFNFREDAIRNGRQELCIEEDESFYIGRKNPYIFPTIDAKDFFNNIIESDYDNFGDWSEHWETSFGKNLEAVNLVQEKLSEIADIIMDKHKPTFYMVSDSELIQNKTGGV